MQICDGLKSFQRTPPYNDEKVKKRTMYFFCRESKYIFKLIKQEYQKNIRIERILNPEKSFSIQKSYINLAIVTSKEQDEKEHQLRHAQHGDTIMSAFEDIYGIKITTEIDDIFNTCPNEQKHVLMFGRAGIGKSTFCRYVAYQWAIGAIWTEYELLALIPLRCLTTDRYRLLPPGQDYSLVDLLKKEVFSMLLSEKEDRLLTTVYDAKKTLWILDGYDEIVQNVPSHLKCLLNQLLKTPHHIVTSRPYQNTLSYDVKMEITGFTDENIEEYIENFFNQMKDELDNTIIKSQTLLNYLQSNRSIWGVAHIPVNLELICSIWSNKESLEIKDLTITSLYSVMTEWLCRRYLTSINKRSLQLPKDEIDQCCQKELAFLESLAFHAMKSNTIILQPSSLKKALKEANISFEDCPHILNIGILKSFNKKGTGTQIEIDKDHYFIHLSFQEYFAARYVIHSLQESSTEKAIEFIKCQKYNQRYTLVFTFMSGLLTNDDLQSCSNIFWDGLLGEPVDLIGIRHIQLIIVCLEAMSNRSILLHYNNLLTRITECIQHSFYHENKTLLIHLSHSFQRAPSLTCNHKIINMLNNLLQSEETKIKSEVLLFISQLKIWNPSVELIQSILRTMQDTSKDIRIKACLALGSISEKAAIDEVISQLMSALDDEDAYVRAGASYALGMVSDKTLTNNAIDKLVYALQDENESVRASASYTLEKLSVKKVTNETISKLVNALGHDNQHVRARIRYFFGNIGENVVTREVIDKLLSALKHTNDNVRAGVIYVLGKSGRQAMTDDVIGALLSALGEVNEYVRSNACEALGSMGEKEVTNEVIHKLLIALGDESGSVRRSACEALQNMGEKGVTNQVIGKLISDLDSANDNDRRNACEALGYFSEKPATEEMIKKLINALQDESELVRIGACKALGMKCVKAPTNEIISSLANALRDTNEKVRVSVCESLEMVSEKVSTDEVINKLVDALGDDSRNVRAGALYVLGKMGKKAANQEVIRKVVNALKDQDITVRSSACYTLADFGGERMTNEVMNALMTALGDMHENVRAGALKALAKIRDIVVTNEDISSLVNAPGDVNGYVRYYACEALGNISEKTATNKIISDLIGIINKDHYVISKRAAETVSNMITSSFDLTQLDLQLISDVCLSKHGSICSKNLSIEQLINIYFATKNTEYLSVIYLFALLQGIAMTTHQNKLIIYSMKQPFEIAIPSIELGQHLRQFFIGEAKRLHLDVRMFGDFA